MSDEPREHGPWVRISLEDKHVTWACSSCRMKVTFGRAGSGEEPASPDDKPPEDILDYAEKHCHLHLDRVAREKKDRHLRHAIHDHVHPEHGHVRSHTATDEQMASAVPAKP